MPNERIGPPLGRPLHLHERAHPDGAAKYPQQVEEVGAFAMPGLMPSLFPPFNINLPVLEDIMNDWNEGNLCTNNNGGGGGGTAEYISVTSDQRDAGFYFATAGSTTNYEFFEGGTYSNWGSSLPDPTAIMVMTLAVTSNGSNVGSPTIDDSGNGTATFTTMGTGTGGTHSYGFWYTSSYTFSGSLGGAINYAGQTQDGMAVRAFGLSAAPTNFEIGNDESNSAISLITGNSGGTTVICIIAEANAAQTDVVSIPANCAVFYQLSGFGEHGSQGYQVFWLYQASGPSSGYFNFSTTVNTWASSVTFTNA